MLSEGERLAKRTMGLIIMFIVMGILVIFSGVAMLYLVAYMKNLGV